MILTQFDPSIKMKSGNIFDSELRISLNLDWIDQKNKRLKQQLLYFNFQKRRAFIVMMATNRQIKDLLMEKVSFT